MLNRFLLPIATATLLLTRIAWSQTSSPSPSAADYPSLHAAVEANPGKMLFLPPGDYLIDQKLVLRGDRCGLYGPGRIIQQNPEQPIVVIENANAAELRDITLTRPEGKQETTTEGLNATGCKELVIDNVRVLNNLSRSAAIRLHECRDARISHCLVRNYMRVSIDDRTHSPHWGYAFNCTDGTGIGVTASIGTLIEGNRVVEERLVPTPEIKAQYKLGDFIKKNATKGTIINQQMWDSEYTDAWQQGSAIFVSSPDITKLTRILGNHVENAAQGIDLHCDQAIVSNNIVSNAFIGLKAMHGSRHIVITSNQFTRNSLWAIGLMPGASANTENFDGGSIIANNIVSDFGHGDAHWIWGTERAPFKFDSGQQPDDPPLTDVLVQGNVLFSVDEPRYQYAVIVAGGKTTPRGLHFTNNLLHPGKGGIANIDLPQ